MFSNKNKPNFGDNLCIPELDNLSITSPDDLPGGYSRNAESPLVRRVFLEEIISPTNNESFNRRRKVIEVIDNFNNSFSTSTIIRQETVDNFEETPMEIDSSFDNRFPKMMGNEYLNRSIKKEMEINEAVDDEENEVRDCSESKEMRTVKINHVVKRSSKKWIYVIPLIPIIIFTVHYCLNILIIINSDVQTERIQTDLMDKVHGQEKLIESLIHIIDSRQNWERKTKVLVFVGSQGVGKTFVANLLKNHFHPSLVHDFYGSQLFEKTEKEQLIQKINSWCLNLLVIDDLTIKDNDEFYSFIETLPKNSFILIVAIYNIHYMTDDLDSKVEPSDILKIRDGFDASGINYDVLHFKDFTKVEIKDWLRKQIRLRNLSDDVEEDILEIVLGSHNIKHGLKGLSSKLILEIEKQKN